MLACMAIGIVLKGREGRPDYITLRESTGQCSAGQDRAGGASSSSSGGGGKERISGSGALVNKELHKPHPEPIPPARPAMRWGRERREGERERDGEECKPPFRSVRPRPACSHLARWTMDMYIMDAFDNIEPSLPRCRGCNPFIKMHLLHYMFRKATATLNGQLAHCLRLTCRLQKVYVQRCK